MHSELIANFRATTHDVFESRDGAPAATFAPQWSHASRNCSSAFDWRRTTSDSRQFSHGERRRAEDEVNEYPCLSPVNDIVLKLLVIDILPSYFRAHQLPWRRRIIPRKRVMCIFIITRAIPLGFTTATSGRMYVSSIRCKCGPDAFLFTTQRVKRGYSSE